MSDRIVQLQDYNSDNIYPVAGAATQGSITKTMLDEGVFEGPELSDPGNIAYVGTSAIQDNAVTADKIAIPCPVISDILSTPSSVAYVATDNIQDGAVTSDKIDSATFKEGKKSVSSVSLTANTWTTIGTITLPAHTTGIVTASAYVAAASGSGRFNVRITGAGGTVHGTSNAALSTTSTTRATTCAIYNHNGDSNTTWLAQVHCDLAATLTWGETAILVLPQADTSVNLVS